jgi:large subunit ribosomal protein L23
VWGVECARPVEAWTCGFSAVQPGEGGKESASMREAHQIIKRPLITEKSTKQKEEGNQIAFVVDLKASKIEIRQAVEKLFKVKVRRVHTMNLLGKRKRLGRFIGWKSDWKKAIVTLREGDRIEFFEGV